MGKPTRRRASFFGVAILAGAACFGLGWFAKSTSDRTSPPQALRLNGYQFIDPLLACNINNTNVSQENKSLTSDVASIINTHTQSGDLSKASVYFTDLTSGNWANVDQGETYYPSSLGKIPIMMAYYELAENSSTVLDQRITYTGGQNLNDTQDIPPAESIVPGQTYTVEQLIEYMVEYSDNNATQLLYNNIDQDTLQHVYGDLGIPTEDNPTAATLDFITPQQIALLFRVLYNGTYLSRDYSEKALQVMSQSSFTQGIVSGVPSSTVVSHKLGLVGIQTNGVTTEHELHDCGIVYARDPYVLCVMTRGTAPLTTMESIIAQISQTAYQHVENGG
jgi:beta-lactamase class A